MEITITRGKYEKISLTIYEDANIDDWVKTFKTILKWVTFADETINDVFGKEEE